MHSLPSPAKKRKTTSNYVSAADNSTQIQQLEGQLTRAISSDGSINALDDLLNLTLKTADTQVVSKAIYALYRVFVLIISSGKLAVRGEESAKVVRGWIWERLNGYVEILSGLLKDQEKTLRVSSLRILFSILKHLSTSLGSSATDSNPTSQPQFHGSHFKKIVIALLLCPPSHRLALSVDRSGQEATDGQLDPDVRNSFVESWLSVHDDVRWFFLREAASFMATDLTPVVRQQALENLISVLERLQTFPTDPSELNSWWIEELGVRPSEPKQLASRSEDDLASHFENDDDWRKFFDEQNDTVDSATPNRPNVRLHTLSIHQSLHSLSAHRAVFTRTWLVLLQQLSSFPAEMKKKLSSQVLNIMHRGVLPHLTRTVLVMDWVAACVDYGGAVGLLALNTLFILMREYNLDYPSFYSRLYAFLDREVLHLKHRARFIRMTELFLSSTHLPATLLASFIKRLSRLSLNAPPAAIVVLVPFTYNILKRHPALMVMIHRIADIDRFEKDSYITGEPNPNLTNALDSSLWELYSHRNHYHPAVSTLVRIFEEAFTKPGYSMEDFLDHTYATLFETGIRQKIKRVPAVDTKLSVPFPSGFALHTKIDNADESDVVSDLWTFT